MNKLTLKDVDIRGKRLLMRVDFNVPLDENQTITDDNRIMAALPSITYAMEQGAKLVLMSHLGRPKGKIVPELSLKPVAVHLGELLKKPVGFATDCIGEQVEAQVSALKNGSVILLENLRFHPGETANQDDFADSLARLGDLYANDAFGTAHRAHASTVGVAEKFPIRLCGFLMQKELRYLGAAVSNPARPYVAILGGAKIADKIPVIDNLVDRVDRLLIGGGMMFTFLKAQGREIGASLLDEESLPLVKDLLKRHEKKIILPDDCLVSDQFDFTTRQIGELKKVTVDEIPADWIGLDIGPDTVARFRSECVGVRTIIWNGPMGVFEVEETARGTFEIARLLADLTEEGCTTIVGGGDSASALKKAGLTTKVSHVSTGGGASLELLEGKILPGVAVLSDREKE